MYFDHSTNSSPDDLCLLLQSTHFFYTIQSRLRKERDLAGSQAKGLRSDPLPEEPKDTDDVELDVSALHIRIIWNHDSWATQLLHHEALLLEGRQINVQQCEGFEKSFEWFCAEARFLWFQFKAQEGATAAQGAGTAQLSETKQTKAVVLNIHVRFVDGRPILACSRLQD